MPQPAFDTHAEAGKLKQAGCPEKQAEAMVDLVSRAPLNAQTAKTLDKTQHRLESIESTMATKAALETLRADIAELRGFTTASIEALRAQKARMLWVQGLALATLIISLAGSA